MSQIEEQSGDTARGIQVILLVILGVLAVASLLAGAGISQVAVPAFFVVNLVAFWLNSPNRDPTATGGHDTSRDSHDRALPVDEPDEPA
jgi:hypothetical protein